MLRSSTTRSASLVALLLLGSACEEKVVPAPTRSAAPPKPTQAPPRPSASATGSASASAAPTTSVAIPERTGPLRWADFGGPFPRPTVTRGDKAWCAVPISGGWETLKLTVLEVADADETHVRAKVGDSEYFVPAAFVARSEAARGLAKGSPVIASAEGTRVFGRVVTADTNKSTVRYRFAGTDAEKELDNTLLILLDGTLRYGGLVAFDGRREGEKTARWRLGTFVSAQEERTWLLDTSGKPLRLPSAQVRAIPTAMARVGDRVVVARQGDFVPATVKRVVEDGLQYEVAIEDGSEFVVSFEAVAPPIP